MLAIKMTLSATFQMLMPLPGVNKEQAESSMKDEAVQAMKAEVLSQWRDQLSATGAEMKAGEVEVELVEV